MAELIRSGLEVPDIKVPKTDENATPSRHFDLVALRIEAQSKGIRVFDLVVKRQTPR